MNLTSKNFENMTEEEKRDLKEKNEKLMIDLLSDNILNFIQATSSMNFENSDRKSKSIARVIINRLKNLVRETGENFRTVTERMMNKAFDEYDGEEIFNYAGYFLKKITGEAESFALKAWNDIYPSLAWMKETTTYTSSDPFTLAAIKRISILRIKNAQESKEGYNRLNMFQEKQIKEDFLKYYKEAYRSKSGISELTGTGANKKQLKAGYELPERVLLTGSEVKQLNAVPESVVDMVMRAK